MSRTLRLTVTTPFEVLIDDSAVVSFRAEDESGSFGILPGHVDMLTALPVSVVRWKNAGGTTRYCALRGGVMTVSGGGRIAIVCRQGTSGGDLAQLADSVRLMEEEEADAERRARTAGMQMHARAVRQLVGYLHPNHRGIGPAGWGDDT